MKPQTRTLGQFLIETAFITIKSQLDKLTDKQIEELEQIIKEHKKNKVKIIHL